MGFGEAVFHVFGEQLLASAREKSAGAWVGSYGVWWAAGEVVWSPLVVTWAVPVGGVLAAAIFSRARR